VEVAIVTVDQRATYHRKLANFCRFLFSKKQVKGERAKSEGGEFAERKVRG
jgi:hypothetical protein